MQEKQQNQKGKIMINVNDRSKYDDFEMEDEYDFSNGIRGKFYKPKKIPITIILDADILLFLKKEANEKKIEYQTLINLLLREHTKFTTIAPIKNIKGSRNFKE